MAELGPEKRVLVAFALSTLVLLAWSFYMQKRYPQERVLPAPPAEAEAPAPAPAPAPAKLEKPRAPARALRQGKEEREITVETDVARLVFSTRGGVVKSWTLKQYKDAQGKPLELVQATNAGLGYPLSWTLADTQRERVLNQALFVASPESAELSAPAELSFEYSDGKLAATKRLRFAEGYLVELETQVLAEGTPVEHGLAWRGGFGDAALDTAWADLRLIWRERGRNRIERKPADKLGKDETFRQPFSSYAGFEDRYFTALFLPAVNDSAATLTARRLTGQVAGGAKPRDAAELGVSWPAESPGRLFVGPKALEVLEQIQPAASSRALDEVVDFGFFDFLARPIFLAMRWIYRHWIPNYGWAIVLLTVGINMGLFPLKWKSMLSAWKMQKIAPQMRAIQEKYKKYRFNDPRKQQELMALYREHGVNPVGGCLPLLLQIPFFYAFYQALLSAIELRRASWLWVSDLSDYDKTYVLPVVMTLTMYISTKMTPMSTADPAQQKLMTLMPLFFGVMFVRVSAGLVLYWLVSNLVGIGQQYWMNRHQRTREEAEKQAKRKKKP